jgi:hypothetical protein
MTALLLKSKFQGREVITLSRGARCYFTLSREIARHQKTDPAYRGTRTQRIIGILYQLALRVSMLFKKNIGEELLVISTKQGDPSQ